MTKGRSLADFKIQRWERLCRQLGKEKLKEAMNKKRSALAEAPTVEIDSKMEAEERVVGGRVKRRQKKTRIRLLKAGYGLITEKGIDETAIMEITDAADVGFGTFYNYFSSKDDIAMQILDCVVHALGERS